MSYVKHDKKNTILLLSVNSKYVLLQGKKQLRHITYRALNASCSHFKVYGVSGTSLLQNKTKQVHQNLAAQADKTTTLRF